MYSYFMSYFSDCYPILSPITFAIMLSILIIFSPTRNNKTALVVYYLRCIQPLPQKILSSLCYLLGSQIKRWVSILEYFPFILSLILITLKSRSYNNPKIRVLYHHGVIGLNTQLNRANILLLIHHIKEIHNKLKIPDRILTNTIIRGF